MTTATILKEINALPTTERMPESDNPSPSGDPWYDDPRNIAIVMEGIKSAMEEEGIVLKTKEDIKNYFANL
jgi:hypothetical protein